MTDFRILFDGSNHIALPDGYNLGVQGEHNAVQLVISLPVSMVQDMSYHVVTLGGVQSAIITDAAENVDGAYRFRNTIYFPLTAAYTKSCNADLTVTAYRQTGSVPTVVDKTPTVYGLRFSAGDAVDIPGGLVAQVAEIAKTQHTHPNKPTLDKLTEEDGTLYLDGKRLDGVIVWPIRKDPVIPAQPDGTLLYTVYGEDGLMNSDPYLVEIQGVLYRKPAPWKPGQLWVCRGGIWYLLTSEGKTNFDPSKVVQGGGDIIDGDLDDVYAPAPEPGEDEIIVDGVKLLPFGKPLDLVCDKPETAHYYLADENITTNRQYLIEVLTESANRSIRIACYNGMFSVVYEKFGEQKKYYQNGSWDSAPDLSAFKIAAVKFNGIDTETVSSLDAILENPDHLKMYTSFCQAFQSCAIEDFNRYAPIDGAYEALSDTVVCDGRVYAAELKEYTTAIQTSRDRFLGTKDSYATVYIDCDADVDVAFDADYLVGGEVPNTKAGRHKLIYNILPDGTVSLGSLDLEAKV